MQNSLENLVKNSEDADSRVIEVLQKLHTKIEDMNLLLQGKIESDLDKAERRMQHQINELKGR